MSIIMHIEGFAPPDNRWREMKAVYDSCTQADIPVPIIVQEYFNFSPPDPSGVVINLRTIAFEFNNEDEIGYEIDIDDLPKNVKKIRFYCAW